MCAGLARPAPASVCSVTQSCPTLCRRASANVSAGLDERTVRKRPRWDRGQLSAPGTGCVQAGVTGNQSAAVVSCGCSFPVSPTQEFYDSCWKASKSTKINSSESWPAKPQAGDHSFSPEIRKVPKLLICKHVKSRPGFGDILLLFSP